MLPNPGEQRVAAARDQAEERRLDRIGLEEVGRDVTVEVIDPDQRQPVRGGQRLCRAHADQQRPDQPGGRRDRDGVKIGKLSPGVREGPVDHGVDELEVVARGDLGDDASVALVEGGLRGNEVGENPGAVEDRGAGVVAGGLER